MFADTLDSSWAERSRRGWTTLTSFGLQALVAGFLVLLPLLRPAGLPSFRQLVAPITLGQPLGEQPVTSIHAGTNPVTPSNPADIVFRQPSRIPNRVAENGDEGPPLIGGPGPYTSGGTGPGIPGGVLDSLGNGMRPFMPLTAKPVVIAPLRVSNISEGDLIRKVRPAYPPLARSARIQGVVLLQAVISKQGTIENLKVVTGHPMLVQAAIEAVKQWRYRPYILNNEPVEVETQITVNFSLTGN